MSAIADAIRFAAKELGKEGASGPGAIEWLGSKTLEAGLEIRSGLESAGNDIAIQIGRAADALHRLADAGESLAKALEAAK